MKLGRSQRFCTTPLRRYRLSQLCLFLCAIAVHGLPWLHLAWHRPDHVHVGGGQRFVHPTEKTQSHDGSNEAGHVHSRAGHSHPRRVLGWFGSAQGRLPLEQIVADDGSGHGDLHLPLGAAHGLSFVAPTRFVPWWDVGVHRQAAGEPGISSLRLRIVSARARAPPGWVCTDRTDSQPISRSRQRCQGILFCARFCLRSCFRFPSLLTRLPRKNPRLQRR
ncbi:MAG TPA: hypothetical protein PLY80_17640 [Pseudomonadota bacterium]|nr:hypothetical protein [Pseudomonadota bacterium]